MCHRATPPICALVLSGLQLLCCAPSAHAAKSDDYLKENAPPSAACLHYEPAKVTIQGTLIYRHQFKYADGSPGTSYFLLVLDQPICVEAPEQPVEETDPNQSLVNALQVAVSKRTVIKKPLVHGLHVTISGVLVSASEFSQASVVIQADRIR
jgi:hypothetical protein